MDRLLCVVFFFWFAALSGSLEACFFFVLCSDVPFVVYL